MRFLLCWLVIGVFNGSVGAEVLPQLFYSSFPEVKSLAQAEGKSILLFFTSSDHSGLGMKMSKEVLSDPLFIQRVQSQLLAYEVDFPIHHDVSQEQQELHASLRAQYHVEALPCLMLLNAHGEEIVRMGYVPMESQALANDLLYLLSLEGEVHMRLAHLGSMGAGLLRDTYEKALRLSHSDWIEQILEKGGQSESPAFFLVEQYRRELFHGAMDRATQIRSTLFELDPNNRLGCHYDLAMIDFQFSSQYRQGEEVIDPLLDYIAQFGRDDPEHVWKIEMMIAQYFLDQDRLNPAWEHAQLAWSSAPQDRRQEISSLLDYIHDHSHTACH